MQDKDSTRSSINKRMNVVHRCIRTPNIVLRALREVNKLKVNELVTVFIILTLISILIHARDQRYCC